MNLRVHVLFPWLVLVALGCSSASERSGPALDSRGGSGDGSGGRQHGNGGSGIVIPPAGGTTGGDDDCSSTLQVIYRDFRETHPDFEMDFRGDVVRRGLVEPTLGTDQKPVFKASIGCPADEATPLDCNDDWTVEQPVVTSAESFAQWYRTVADVNLEIPGTIELVETPVGSGEYVFESSAFFPLASTDGFGVTPVGHYMGKNFLFTTEVHVAFTYRAGQKFAFRGDDDVWIFVNGKLAMDLGSMHGPVPGVIDFDAQASALGIQPGGIYRMDVFHAERHTDGSNFKFTTNIACFTPVIVR